MRAEDLARSAQFREGFTLVDYAEVGLPIFRLTIEAITTATRSMPTIQEFSMRCLALGETEEFGIARMLGLKEDIVRAAVDTLVTDGLVARTAIVSDVSSFALTPAGQDRLEKEAREVVQEEMIVVDYDGMRRMPVRVAGDNVVKAAELKTFGAVEIRPYPANPPSVADLSIPEVRRVIRRQRGDDFRHNVLALKRVVRRNNVFREAVALVYAADRGDEIQIAFALDGKLSESHERAFAENGGPKKMGFVRMIAEGKFRRRLERLIGKDAIKLLPDRQSLRQMRKEEAEAMAQVRSIELAVEIGGNRRASNPAAAALATARDRLMMAEHELDSLPLRPLACYEQDELLAEATTHARRSLVITSAGLQPTVLTKHVLRDMDRLVGERAALCVGSFLKPQIEPRGGDHYDPLAELTRRAQRNRVSLLQINRGDFFFLVKDDDLAVVSNRPFLGEIVRRSGFQRVEGYISRDRWIVERIRRLAEEACRPRRNG